MSMSSATPEQVHLALGHTADVLRLQWATDVGFAKHAELCGRPGVVSYGRAPSTLVHRAVAECTPLDLQNASYLVQSNYVASLNLTRAGAKPGETMYYTIGSRLHNLTVPRAHADVEIAILGDLGTRTASGEHTATALPAIHAAVAAGELDMVVHLGDAAYNFDVDLSDLHKPVCPAHPGGAHARLFMNDLQNISSRVPYMFVHGNHDKPFDFAYPTELFRNMPHSAGTVATGNKASPNAPNNWWYSWEVPGLATFVALSTEIMQCCSKRYHHMVPAQYAWLRATLAGVDRHSTPWLIVIGHRPLYCSEYEPHPERSAGGECNQTTGATQLRRGLPIPAANGSASAGSAYGLDELFAAFRVDLYLSAHNHNYERMYDVAAHEDATQPWRSGKSARTLVDMAATTHVVEGGAGTQGHHELLINATNGAPWGVHSAADLPTRLAFRTTAIGYSRLTLANATHARWRRFSTHSFGDDGLPPVPPTAMGHVVDDVWLVQHHTSRIDHKVK